MKVYVAIWKCDWEGFNYPAGVFSTREKALLALDAVEVKGDDPFVFELELNEITRGLEPFNI